MKRKTTAALILGILLVGLTTMVLATGFIHYFGKITGTSTVNAPTFLASNNVFIGNSTYYNMGNFNFTANETNKSVGISGNNVWFISYPLNITQLSKAEYNMTLDSRSDNESGQLNVQLWIIGNETNSYGTIEPLCSANIGVFNRSIYNISCTGNQINNMDPSWRLGLELSNGSESTTYYVYLNGKTKVEMIVK